MFHHDGRDYQVAAGEAAKVGRERMEQMIAKGRAAALAAVEQVQREVPHDYLATTSTLRVKAAGDGAFTLEAQGFEPQLLHRHAFGQVAEKAGVPLQYIDTLTGKGGWGVELVQDNFNRIFEHGNGNRHLIRVVHPENDVPEVRGFLSDRFRRLDSRPLLDTFMGACAEFGAVPVDGYALDTKTRVRAILPHVFEPFANEPMLWGIQWGNSNFGDGSHSLGLFNIRVYCTNTATMDEVLRQVHIGRKLEEVDVQYSNRTITLDTEANASAMKDIIHEFLSPARVNGYNAAIRKACEEKIDERDVLRLLKNRLTKGEAEKVQAIYESPDTVNLPAGNTAYRLSNAISFFAQSDGIGRDRQLDLQKAAGELLPALAGKTREV